MTTSAFIQFTCTSCKGALRVKHVLSGKRIKCPKCSQTVRAPVASTTTSTSNVTPAIPAGAKDILNQKHENPSPLLDILHAGLGEEGRGFWARLFSGGKKRGTLKQLGTDIAENCMSSASDFAKTITKRIKKAGLEPNLSIAAESVDFYVWMFTELVGLKDKALLQPLYERYLKVTEQVNKAMLGAVGDWAGLDVGLAGELEAALTDSGATLENLMKKMEQYRTAWYLSMSDEKNALAALLMNNLGYSSVPEAISTLVNNDHVLRTAKQVASLINRYEITKG